jgi:hypothetical protein
VAHVRDSILGGGSRVGGIIVDIIESSTKMLAMVTEDVRRKLRHVLSKM